MNSSACGDTPSISNCAYTSSAVAGDMVWHTVEPETKASEFVQRLIASSPDFSAIQQRNQQTDQPMANTNRRVVQVFIADPNENVPLEHSVLFKGDQKLTDLTDTELFFEVPMADILKSHNDKRVKFLDKEATKRSGKDVTLDPVKIRELKMVVVTVAAF